MRYSRPQISIVVCAYNAEATIARCLSSLVGQTFSEIEIVCINDGSTDKTKRILRDFAKKDRRIRVIHQKNAGVAAARNTALKHILGKYLMFCDADDWFHAPMCAKMIAALEEQEADWVTCGIHAVFDHPEVSSRNPQNLLYYRPCFYGRHLNAHVRDRIQHLLWNKIFKTDIIRRHGLSFPVGCIHEDDAFVESYLMVSAAIYSLPDKLIAHTLADTSQIGDLLLKSDSKHRFDKLHIARFIQEFMLRKGLFYKNQDYFARRLSFGISFCWQRLSPPDYRHALAIAADLLKKVDDVFLTDYPTLRQIKKKQTEAAVIALDAAAHTAKLSVSGALFKRPAHKQQIIPVAFYANAAYLPYLSVAIHSLAAHASADCFYDIYIFSTATLSLNALNKNLPANVSLTNLPQQHYLNDDTAFFSEMAQYSEKCYRLMIPEILREYPKIIYLDCDTLILDDIAKLYQLDIGESIIGAIKNPSSAAQQEHIISLGMDPDEYINAGVLLINTKAYIHENISQKCHRFFMKHGKLAYKDQDLLNLACQKHIRLLPPAWNFCWHTCLSNKDFRKKDPMPALFPMARAAGAAAKIIHFTTVMKPWLLKAHPLAALWWQYARKSGSYTSLLTHKHRNPPLFVPISPDASLPRRIIWLYLGWRLLARMTRGGTAQKYADKAEALASSYFQRPARCDWIK